MNRRQHEEWAHWRAQCSWWLHDQMTDWFDAWSNSNIVEFCWEVRITCWDDNKKTKSSGTKSMVAVVCRRWYLGRYVCDVGLTVRMCALIRSWGNGIHLLRSLVHPTSCPSDLYSELLVCRFVNSNVTLLTRLSANAGSNKNDGTGDMFPNSAVIVISYWPWYCLRQKVIILRTICRLSKSWCSQPCWWE